jgi:4-carboxymuconolactone decarboxylase
MTMRLRDLSYEELDGAQKAVYDKIVAGVRGKVHGPFRALLHRPELLDRAQELGLYCRYNSGLEPRLSELAILVMSAFWRVSGEWYDHYPNAVALGVSREALEALRKGEPARFTAGDEQALYDFAMELNRTHDVSDETYQRALNALGQDKLVDLVGVLGYYALISMTLKVFKVPLPDGVQDPFAS